MGIHTQVGHIVHVTSAPGAVAVVIECDEDVCEPAEFVMNQDEWTAFVAQGHAALSQGVDE